MVLNTDLVTHSTNYAISDWEFREASRNVESKIANKLSIKCL